MLLSIGAVQEDLRVMLPFIVTACARYFGPRELVRVLPEIDAGMVLARAMLGNVPSALAPFVAACLEFGGDGESGGNVAEVGGGGAGRGGGGAGGWWVKALWVVAEMSVVAAMRVRRALLEAQIMPALVVRT